MVDDNSPCGSADTGAEIIREGVVRVLPATSSADGREAVPPTDGVSAAPDASPLASVPMLTTWSSPGCMTKKIAILTDATAPMAANPRRSLRQCRLGAGFPGDSGFAISP